MLRRLISSFLILCLTFSQVAQAYTQAWLPHRPAQHSIELTATGTLNNSGNIQSGSATLLSARDLFNANGNINSQGDLLLQADHDILNQSGSISGRRVQLSAGHDLLNSTLTRSISFGNGAFGASNTLIGRTGNISALDSLSMNAGHDLTVTGAVLSVLSASSFVAFDLKFFTVFFALCTGILSLIYQYQEFFPY